MENAVQQVFCCAYCKVLGTLSVIEAHQKTAHPDLPFQPSQARFAYYLCAECDFTIFTLGRLEHHFELEHAGMEMRYYVASTEADIVPITNSHDLSDSDVSVVDIDTEYTCLRCGETCFGDGFLDHHARLHPDFPHTYSVRRSNTPDPAPAMVENPEDDLERTEEQFTTPSLPLETPDLDETTTETPQPSTNSLFSCYGTCQEPTGNNHIKVLARLPDSGVRVCMRLADFENITDLYPAVIVKDLKYEKWF